MSRTVRVLFIIAILAVIGIASYYIYGTYVTHTGRRQAVFLTNGQVYFGYLGNANGQFIHLTNVYYAPLDAALQTGRHDQSQNISLIKLGQELQGPEDEMFIARDQILFYENMRPDSKVNDAIKKYLDTQKPSPSPSPSSSASP